MEILEVKNLTKKFKGLVALNNVSFKIKEGEIVGLIGPNGAGKSTLFDMISGIRPPDGSSPFPDSGDIIFKGKNITSFLPYIRCNLGIGRTFQLTKPLKEISVFENVYVALLFSKKSKESKTNISNLTMDICEFVGLGKKVNDLASSLTVPDRKKLELARALATKPDLLLLDEVMAGLNPSEIIEACNLIKKIRETGITILAVEHVMKAIMNISDQIIVLDHGVKISEGKPNDVVNDPRVLEAYLGGEKNSWT